MSKDRINWLQIDHIQKAVNRFKELRTSNESDAVGSADLGEGKEYLINVRPDLAANKPLPDVLRELANAIERGQLLETT